MVQIDGNLSCSCHSGSQFGMVLFCNDSVHCKIPIMTCFGVAMEAKTMFTFLSSLEGELHEYSEELLQKQ
jgi:hypothetical protein